MKTCFIGGTGRCGTSILRTVLSRHSSVATLPIEHRLTVDPDGIFDFYRSYTTGWSPSMLTTLHQQEYGFKRKK